MCKIFCGRLIIDIVISIPDKTPVIHIVKRTKIPIRIYFNRCYNISFRGNNLRFTELNFLRLNKVTDLFQINLPINTVYDSCKSQSIAGTTRISAAIGSCSVFTHTFIESVDVSIYHSAPHTP